MTPPQLACLADHISFELIPALTIAGPSYAALVDTRGEPHYTCCTIQALRGHTFDGFVRIYRQEDLTWLIEGVRVVCPQAMRTEGSSTGKHRYLGMPSNIHQDTRGVDGHAGVTP
jgi:hypothetical protein